MLLYKYGFLLNKMKYFLIKEEWIVHESEECTAHR